MKFLPALKKRMGKWNLIIFYNDWLDVGMTNSIKCMETRDNFRHNQETPFIHVDVTFAHEFYMYMYMYNE